MILPPLAVVLGLDVLLLRVEAPATLGVLAILVVQALPYTTYVMYATYLAYDDRYELEARSLGASTATVLRRVHIPLVAPGLAAALFLSLLVGWSDYVVTLVVGGGRLVTLPVLIAANAAGTGNEPAVAALSLAAVAPPLALMTLAALVGRRARHSPAVS
jgi:putative spermidine/putrescine transport system permease protein